jgi:hypothetical protein
VTFAAILDRFEAKRVGQSFMAKCPAHADGKPSLSISEKDGNIVLHCHAGCDTRDVLKAKGLSFEDLHEAPRLAATYQYTDEHSALLFECVRYEPKGFRQRRPDGKGGWIWDLNGTRRVLYNLPEVVKADSVVLVEGEKDVETARKKFGLVATCNPMGAGKWRPEYAASLAGKRITIIPDSDEPGRKHAEQIAASLQGKAASVAICNLPEGVKDLSDWLLSVESLLDLIKKAPAWKAGEDDLSLYVSFDEFELAQPANFAIEKVLQLEAVNAIAGLSGQAKTWLALSITRALLFGPGNLWDLFAVKERAERVIYLIPESMTGPFKTRLEKMGLYDEVRSGRLLVRTLSKGPAPDLKDPRLLRTAKNAFVICDTGIRFMQAMENENSASEAARGLTEDFFQLLRAEAKAVLSLFHSPESFNLQSPMTLESMIRGSGEFGAMLAAAWGVKQTDKIRNVVHLECLKARDFDPCDAFELEGRPHIDETGDFKLIARPGECELKSANDKRSDQKHDRVGIVAGWLEGDVNLTAADIVTRFALEEITIKEDTAYRYRADARKRVFKEQA